MDYQYKSTKSLLERQTEANSIIGMYPLRIPIICEKDQNSLIPDIQKKKYLVPYDMTVSQFSFIIRRKLELAKEAALFLLVNDNKTGMQVQPVDLGAVLICNLCKDNTKC